MLKRLVKPLLSNSFFLFGARGTGKSTFLKRSLLKNSITFDLLDDETFDRLLRTPKYIESLAQDKKYSWIILDEVQRLPKILDVVHRCIENYQQKFAMTGSSARKLRRGGANLLAGRAYHYTLHPLTALEWPPKNDLSDRLRFGSLPKLTSIKSEKEKIKYLKSYNLTYVKEEIQMEQIVRKLEPFREFLPVSAQMSGKVINFSKIAKEVGVQIPTCQNYFQILEETFIGFHLPHFHKSIRKSQTHAPKFYFFDHGVRNSLCGFIESKPMEGSSFYGELFEGFLIQEIYRLNEYFDKDFRLSFFRTKNGFEIDLILYKPNQTILVEIKSSNKIDETEVKKLASLTSDFGKNVKRYYLSRDTYEVTLDSVECLPWNKFLDRFARL